MKGPWSLISVFGGRCLPIFHGARNPCVVELHGPHSRDADDIRQTVRWDTSPRLRRETETQN
jgi:hypothetical protein